MMTLFGELRRRNVFRVGAAYLAVAWLILQVVDVINEPLELPERFDTIVVVLLAIGFPIALFLAWAYELTPQGIRRADDVSADDTVLQRAGASGQPLNYMILGVLALAVAFLFFDRFTGSDRVSQPPEFTAATRPAASDSPLAAPESGAGNSPPESRIGIAVLPFRNLSTDSEAGNIADGLSAQLSAELRGIAELFVTDPRAAFRYENSSLPRSEIAAELGVAHLLEGVVVGNDSTLRISVELTRVDDDMQLWANSWDFSDPDTLAISDAITSAVTQALSVTLGILDRGQIRTTTSVEAFNEYLSGLGQIGRFSAAASRNAFRSFQRAIAIDPDFFTARIALAQSYEEMAIVVPPGEAEQWRQRSAETLAGARELASGEAEIALVDLLTAVFDGNWLDAAGAEARLAALGVNARYRSASLGGIYMATGRVREAIPWLEEARAMDPFAPAFAAALGGAYAMIGDFDAAQAEYDRGLALATDGQIEARLRGATWIAALAARDRIEFERRLDSFPSTDNIAESMRALLDEPAAALEEIRRRIANPEVTALNKAILAHFATWFGDPELALEILRSVTEEPYFWLMLWDAGQAETRALPGFKALVTDLGLLAYWREYGWPDFCRPLGNDDFVCE